MTIRIRVSLLLAGIALLAGCATKPQAPVEFKPVAGANNQKVGVAMAKVPKASLDLPGAYCLLCIAAAQIANAPLGRHVDTLGTEELQPVRDGIAERLRKRGIVVVVIPEPIALDTLAEMSGDTTDKARRDFRPLRARYGVDKLVVVSVDALGIQRAYSAYVPTSDPRAFVRGAGYMVDLTTNGYDWYRPVNVTRPADGPWDEPPRFPGLTNAYFQALEESKDWLLQPLSP